MPSAPVFCELPVPPPVPDGWESWNYVLTILLEELNTIGDACDRLANLWRHYGYIVRIAALAKDELPENGEDGFRIYYCRSNNEYCDFVFRDDGSLYLRNTVPGPNVPTEVSKTAPGRLALEQFQKGLEWLMLR